MIIMNTEAGIYLTSSSGNVIRNNICYANGGCSMILLQSSSNNILMNNTCSSNSAVGIYILDFCDNNKINYNTCFLNREHGIRLEKSSHNEISHNTLSLNPYGIEVSFNNSIGNEIIWNNIVGNMKLGVVSECPWPYPAKVNAIFNWWGDPTGPFHPEKNPNGLGDPALGDVIIEPWAKEYICDAPSLPRFKASNLIISPDRAMPRQPITISVDIENIGREEETHTVELIIRGESVAKENVTLNSKELRRINFIVFREKPGVYEFAIEGLTGYFRVNEPK